MHLTSVRLVGHGPFDDLTLSLADEGEAPRPVTVIFGGGGVGKTSLLGAIASTRPGLAVALTTRRPPAGGKPAFAVTTWKLGVDDPARPHPLRVASPNAQLEEPDDVLLLGRREQALYDRRAVERGSVVLLFSAARWFSRSPLLLTAPERTVARYDVRAAPNLDDATRGDLTRETKQALSYAAIGAAIGASAEPSPLQRRLADLDATMRQVVTALTSLGGFDYLGADPLTLEPLFSTPGGEPALFDELPTAMRHLAAFGALTVRALFAAYPDLPLAQAEGVVLVDELALHQEPAVERHLLPALRTLLPRVQWVVTTSSTSLVTTCEPGELIALRRTPPSARVELYEGPLAVVH